MSAAVATPKATVDHHRRPPAIKHNSKPQAPRINSRAPLDTNSFSGFG